MLHEYRYNTSMSNLAIHKRYNDLLNAERQTNMELRNEHAEWQGRLGHVGAALREGLRKNGEEDHITKAAELKTENQVLRRLLGWEIDEDWERDGERKDEVPLSSQSIQQ